MVTILHMWGSILATRTLSIEARSSNLEVRNRISELALSATVMVEGSQFHPPYWHFLNRPVYHGGQVADLKKDTRKRLGQLK